jgi:hypothetical protein
MADYGNLRAMSLTVTSMSLKGPTPGLRSFPIGPSTDPTIDSSGLAQGYEGPGV